MKINRLLQSIFFCLCLMPGFGSPGIGASHAAPQTVTTLADNGTAGSLRQKIISAASGDTIVFQSGLSGTITLTSGELLINKNLIIAGPGASTLAVSGNDASRVFSISPGVNVTLSGLTITSGRVVGLGSETGQGGLGGGINNQGTLTVSRSIISNCYAAGGDGNGASSGNGSGGYGYGGGIYNAGTLTVSNSTLATNTARGGTGVGGAAGGHGYGGFGSGGGIYSSGALAVSSSTLASNSAAGGSGYGGTGSGYGGSGYGGSGSGGGIYSSGTLTVSNSTLASNSAAGAGGAGGTSSGYGGTGYGGSGYGGGILNDNGSTLTVSSSTLASNSATGGSGYGGSGGISYGNGSGGSGTGGGILNSGTLMVSNSISAGNNITPDIYNSGRNIRNVGSMTSGGYNLIADGGGYSASVTTTGDIIGVDARLGPLQDDGGPTQTMLPQEESPAIDRGNTDLTIDQRGVARPQGTADDIGAVEYSKPTYTISGRVATSSGTAISGVSVSRGAVSTPVLTDSNGNYSFTSVPAGSYTLVPSKSGYAFSPATRNVTVGSSNISGQNFTGYNTTLSGRVAFSNGTGIGNVQVRLGTGRSVLTNGAGYYTLAGIVNGAYTVTPVLAGYSFDPAYRSVSINNSNVGNVNFTGGYAINGRIANTSGTGVPGLRVYRTGTTVAAVTNSAGYYAFYGVVNGTYTLTPDTTQGYGYTPVSRSVTINGATVNNQNFIATTGFRITGRVMRSNGTAVPNVSVTRTGSTTPVTTNGAGYYTFNGVPSGTYTVTPSLGGFTFTPANKTVTVSGADPSAQNFIGTGP